MSFTHLECPDCHAPMTVLGREVTGDEQEVLYGCAAAQEQSEPWPGLEGQYRWRDGATHTLLQSQVQVQSLDGVPREGLPIVVWDSPVSSTRDEAEQHVREAERQRDAFCELLGRIVRRLATDVGPG